MTDRPILFSGPMVRAILEGRKTQTRRVMKPQPPAGNYRYDGVGDVEKDEDEAPECHWLEVLDEGGEYAERYWKAGKCPYGVPGDRLWVRETWRKCLGENGVVQCYRADGGFAENFPWRPSIHMPRSASRITLEVTGVRAERLQDISEEDAKAEGIEIRAREIKPGVNDLSEYAKADFADLWNSLAKPGSKWADNPWVLVIEFRRVE